MGGCLKIIVIAILYIICKITCYTNVVFIYLALRCLNKVQIEIFCNIKYMP